MSLICTHIDYGGKCDEARGRSMTAKSCKGYRRMGLTKLKQVSCLSCAWSRNTNG